MKFLFAVVIELETTRVTTFRSSNSRCASQLARTSFENAIVECSGSFPEHQKESLITAEKLSALGSQLSALSQLNSQLSALNSQL